MSLRLGSARGIVGPQNLRILKTALRQLGTEASLLEVMTCNVLREQERVKAFRKEFGSYKIGESTIDLMYGGMRGMSALIIETSLVDPDDGICFRGLSIPECLDLLPTAKGGCEPLPEGMFWLMMTGDVPTKSQVQQLSCEWAARARLPKYVVTMLKNMPKDVHPMSQFSAAITALNRGSKFAKAYSSGVEKSKYWLYAYEDSMDLIANVPLVAATIYRNCFRDGKGCDRVDSKLDWSANYANLLTYDDPQFVELMRLYLTIHCDFGGSVSSHSTLLVGSALSDPYLSLASGLNGLAGPLHGRANQEVIVWLLNLQKQAGNNPSEKQLKDYIWNTLKSGRVVPGYGHTVLNDTDSRYICQRDFALKHMPEDELFHLVSKLYKVVPPILIEIGKVRNPWPNVDAHSGVLLYHYGMTEIEFYTVMFGVARSLGVLASLVWDRALGRPIERPKSYTTDSLIELTQQLKKKKNKC